MLEQLRSRTMITTRSGVILRTHIAGKDFRTQLLYNERHNYDTEKHILGISIEFSFSFRIFDVEICIKY